MGKSSNRADGKRAKGKNKKKETFKKYGKNTSRGMRIKQAEMEKKAEKRKNEGDHHLVCGPVRQPDRLRVLEADHGRARHPAERRARGVCIGGRRPEGRLLLRGGRR